jgi:hypothetical protein
MATVGFACVPRQGLVLDYVTWDVDPVAINEHLNPA